MILIAANKLTMTDQIGKILVVDDDPAILEFISIHLEAEGFNPIAAEHGQRALELLSEHEQNIQAIISDVLMPGIDGYTLCERVRADTRFQMLPFIFISSQTDINEKLKGYIAGGDEYFSKPLDPDEMLIKLRYTLANRIKQESLNKQLSDTHSAAMQAMTYSGNLGQILLFLQEAVNVKTFEDLSKLIFKTIANFGLHPAIQYYTKSDVIGFRGDGPIMPLESNIMELSRNESRFFDFGYRTIINYNDFSLLIRNMPKDDPEKYGVMKDVLGNLCNAIEAIVKILLSNEMVNKKTETMVSVGDTLSQMEQSLYSVQYENERAIESMTDDLEEAMITLGLTDAQEDIIRAIAKKCLVESSEAFEKGAALLKSFSNVHDVLKSG